MINDFGIGFYSSIKSSRSRPDMAFLVPAAKKTSVTPCILLLGFLIKRVFFAQMKCLPAT